MYPYEVREIEKSKQDTKECTKSVANAKTKKRHVPESPPYTSSDEKHLECLEPLPDVEDGEVDNKKPESRQSARVKEIKQENNRELENGISIKELKQDSNQELNNGLESDVQVKSMEEDVPVDIVNSSESSSDVSELQDDSRSDAQLEVCYEVGDKVQVKYGRGRNHRLYDAKVCCTRSYLIVLLGVKVI